MMNSSAPITLSDSASARVLQLISEEKSDNLGFRVYITGGGCSGFQYGFSFDKNTRPDDLVVEQQIGNNKVRILVDALSIMYLTGAVVDYIEGLQGAHFKVTNPNAQSTCSCGSSFSIS